MTCMHRLIKEFEISELSSV